MKIYTKSGDNGSTSLAGGERVDKWDPRVETYGTVDELQANVALLSDMVAERSAAFRFDRRVRRLRGELEQIVATLMTVAALFAQGSQGQVAESGLRDADSSPQSYLPPLTGTSLHEMSLLRSVSSLRSVQPSPVPSLPPASPDPEPHRDLPAEQIEWLEGRIDAIAATLPPLRTFTLPGGHPAVSMAHVCRTVCRRAERRALAANAAHPLPANALVWLNRLSDYFYVAARELSVTFGLKEKVWIPE